MSIPVQSDFSPFVAALKNLTVVVHYFSGATPDDMQIVQSLRYTGDIVDISMNCWTDLARFNYDLSSKNTKIMSGIKVSVPDMKISDPRLRSICDKIYENIQLFSRKTNAHLN